jgi:hypothetical protein
MDEVGYVRHLALRCLTVLNRGLNLYVLADGAVSPFDGLVGEHFFARIAGFICSCRPICTQCPSGADHGLAGTGTIHL